MAIGRSVPAQTLLVMLDDPASPARRALARRYPAGTDLGDVVRVCRAAAERFCREFGGERRVFVVRSTGRVNLLGMHVDHRGGFVNPIALREIFLVAEPRDDDEVRLCNADPAFPSCGFRISAELPRGKIRDWDTWTHDEFDRRKAHGSVGHWSNYVKGAVLYLQHLHTRDDGTFDPPLRGMNAAVAGNVPMAAGLSSSSGMIMGALETCLCANGMEMPPLDAVQAGWTAEWYVGTRGGGGDHAAIRCGRVGHVLHIGSFPLSVDLSPFPEGYSVVLANSLVEAKKQEGARDVFNRLVGAYVFGLQMLRRRFARHAERMAHLRDVNPETLGVPEAEIYRMLRALPERASRGDLRRALPEDADLLERTFRTHAEPAEGYRLRAVTLFGAAECARSALGGALLKQGDVATFGRMMTISHDGDRVSRLVDGRRVRFESDCSDAVLDALIADAESGDPAREQRARLWRQPGGYGAGTPEQDTLVDLALRVPGVAGARLVGAGLGGCVAVLVVKTNAARVLEALAEGYYVPKSLPVAAEVVEPVDGAGVLELGG